MTKTKQNIVDAITAMEDLLLEGNFDNPFLIIQTNSCFELGLQHLISEKVECPEYMNFSRISASLMIDLSVSVGAIEPEEAKCFKKFNALRNSVAHQINYNYQDYTKELINSLDGKVKILYTHFRGLKLKSEFKDILERSELWVVVHSMNQFLIKQAINRWDGFDVS